MALSVSLTPPLNGKSNQFHFIQIPKYGETKNLS